MDIKKLEKLLYSVKDGKVPVAEAVNRLKMLPFEDVWETLIDHHRTIRKGFPEVIFGEGKSQEQIISVMEKMVEAEENILITRLNAEKAKEIKDRFPDAQFYPKSRTMIMNVHEVEKTGKGVILVLSAGTSDIPVAEEAMVTARMMGNDVESVYDVGVSGVHRLFEYKEKLMAASVLIVVAGMDGALPSVVGGLVGRPVIAVPTSIGYGASFNGLAALLAMLNSCASNVAVVNIDNGFSAGYIAAMINRQNDV